MSKSARWCYDCLQSMCAQKTANVAFLAEGAPRGNEPYEAHAIFDTRVLVHISRLSYGVHSARDACDVMNRAARGLCLSQIPALLGSLSAKSGGIVKGGVSLSCLYPPLTPFQFGPFGWTVPRSDPLCLIKIFIMSSFYELLSRGMTEQQLNDFGIYSGADHLIGGFSSANSAYLNKIRQALASSVTDITSRDQILNPYDYLDSSLYRNTAKGQALYNEHLKALQAIQSQQEASYKEYYDSPIQQVQREQDAGLNPNLTDSINSGASADAAYPTESPIEGIPTTGEQLGSIASLVSSVASVAALPFSIGSSVAQMSMSSAQKGLLAAQTAGQQIANVSAFEGSVYAAMAANLADAVGSAASSGKKFDFDKWINDPSSSSGIFESYAPEDNPRYRAAFDRAKQNLIRVKGPAYALNADAVGQQTNFAQGLSNPYYDPNLLVQVAGLEPTMDALEQIRVAKEKYFDKVRITKEEYIANLDPAAMAEADVDKAVSEATKAEFEALTAEVNYIVQNAQKTIRMNYMDMYKKDPRSALGLSGAYMVMDGMHVKYSDWLLANGFNLATSPKVQSFVDNLGQSIYRPINPTPSSEPGIYKFGRFMEKYGYE